MNEIFKALSDPTRRQVLSLLRKRPMTAGELADHFTVAKPTMSAHFTVLRQAGLVEAEKSGRSIIYRLKMSVLEEALLGFAQAFGINLKTLDGLESQDLESRSGEEGDQARQTGKSRPNAHTKENSE